MPDSTNEWEKLYDRVFDWHNDAYSHEDHKEYIRTHFIPKAELRKVIEGMRQIGCQHDQDGACYAGKYENELCGESYNQALDDITKRLGLNEK